jgi:hypothetical protein
VKKMKVPVALALPNGLAVTEIEMIDEVLTLTAVSLQMCPCCPLCGVCASRVHSHYTRKLTDLPCGGQRVCLLVCVRKFFCQVSTCARKIFAERLTPFAQPWARVTRRLYQIVQVLGLATGGRLGVRVTDRLGIQTCRTTMLRRIMALPTLPVEHVSELGIDDFCATRSYVCSCRNSRKEDLTWSSASSAEPSLNQEHLGQCSRTRKGDLGTVRGRGDC